MQEDKQKTVVDVEDLAALREHDRVVTKTLSEVLTAMAKNLDPGVTKEIQESMKRLNSYFDVKE